jgi:hypothetical protein
LGKGISKDYASIIGNATADSLVYFGSARPTKWGSLRNDFFYKGFSLSFMITYKGGYYFRRFSSSPNYADVLTTQRNADFTQRWQKPGDEQHTNVPSFVYPANGLRSSFYSYADVLVEKADCIRLQDVRLAYDLTTIIKGSTFKAMQVYVYGTNLGILWRANKFNLDPETNNGYSTPMQLSFGFQTTF